MTFACVKVDDKEIGSWLDAHEMLLYHVAWDWFRHRNIPHTFDDVRDAVAEAMYRIWKYRHRYHEIEGHPHPFETWCSVIVRQSCYWLSQQSHDTTYNDYQPVPSAVPVWTNRHEPDPESVAVNRESIVWQWEHLNPTQRQVVYLRYMGLDEHEIGFELGVTNIRIKSILSSARRNATRNRRT